MNLGLAELVVVAVATGLWTGWAVTLMLGRPKRDVFGQAIGPDFMAFYTGSRLVASGRSAMLYDFPLQHRVQQEIAGGEIPFVSPFVNPPLYAVLLEPLANLPYLVAFALYSLVSFGCLVLVPFLLNAPEPRAAIFFSLGFFPVFSTFRLGQNSLHSLMLFALTFSLSVADFKLLAGLAASSLVFKPQLMPGLLLYWLLRPALHWPALAGAVGGAAVWVLMSARQLPSAWRQYLRVITGTLPSWSEGAGGVKNWMLTTWPIFWRMMLPGREFLPVSLAYACWGFGLAVFVGLIRHHGGDPSIGYSAAVVITLWLAPHANDYEWTQLLMPAVLLWSRFPLQQGELALVYTVVWVALLLAGVLTRLQLQLFRRAINPALPVLAWACWRCLLLVNSAAGH